MKKLNVLLSLSLLVMVLAVSSCNDDEPKSKTDLLTSKTWAPTSVAYQMSSGTELDATAGWIEDCDKDDRLTFSKDGAYKGDPGADDCGGDETMESGTWSWKETETILALTLSGSTSTENFPLISITGSTLRIHIDTIDYDTNGDGIDDAEVKVIYTLTAK